ncbi:hypothetical protein Dimus_025296 [Dionaea muscipula]
MAKRGRPSKVEVGDLRFDRFSVPVKIWARDGREGRGAWSCGFGSGAWLCGMRSVTPALFPRRPDGWQVAKGKTLTRGEQNVRSDVGQVCASGSRFSGSIDVAGNSVGKEICVRSRLQR